MKKINWINSWGQGNKKKKYELILKLGTFTLLEFKACLFCSDKKCKAKRFRFTILNFGFEA